MEQIPPTEYEALAKKITEILPALIDKGEFTNQGSVEERENRFKLASNPLPFFLRLFCYEQTDAWTTVTELHNVYFQFLGKAKRRRLSWRQTKQALGDLGFGADRSMREVQGEYVRDYYINGLGLRKDWKHIMTKLSHLSTSTILYYLLMSPELEQVDKMAKRDGELGEMARLFQNPDIQVNESGQSILLVKKNPTEKSIEEVGKNPTEEFVGEFPTEMVVGEVSLSMNDSSKTTPQKVSTMNLLEKKQKFWEIFNSIAKTMELVDTAWFINRIAEVFACNETEAEDWVVQAKNSGELFEPKPGMLKRL